VLFVDIEAFLVRVCVVKPEGDERINDALDETLVDYFSVSLILDQAEDGAGEFSLFLLDRNEEVVFPLNKGQLCVCIVQSSKAG